MRVESEPGEERRERNVREGGQSEVRQGGQSEVREEKSMVLAGRYWYLTILHMILAGGY